MENIWLSAVAPANHELPLISNSIDAGHHGVVGASASPAVDQAANVAVDGVDVRPSAVHVVHEATDRLAVRRLTVNPYRPGRSQLTAVGVLTRQIDQKIRLVPFLQFVNKQKEHFAAEAAR